jgi:hypothetical protein
LFRAVAAVALPQRRHLYVAAVFRLALCVALLGVLCACPPQAGLSVIFFLGFSEMFKPFNFQLSTVNRPSRQLECL